MDGVRVGGYVQHVSRGFIDRLASFVASRAGRAALHAERAADDSLRFAGLDTVRMTLVPRPAEEKKISDKLIGIFFVGYKLCRRRRPVCRTDSEPRLRI